jgi:hypothetical protein
MMTGKARACTVLMLVQQYSSGIERPVYARDLGYVCRDLQRGTGLVQCKASARCGDDGNMILCYVLLLQ